MVRKIIKRTRGRGKMSELKSLSLSELAERIKEMQSDPEFRKEMKEFIKETAC
jgi:hypothetical protein